MLQAGLSGHGIRVISARVAVEALYIAARQAPSVVVADVDAGAAELAARFCRLGGSAPRLLILGAEPGEFGTPGLRKPYDCRTLIRRIEALLAAGAPYASPPLETEARGNSRRRAA